MAKIPQRIRNSYETYLKYRQQYKDGGYGLDRKLTLEEYADAHIKYVHRHKKDPQVTHVARELASYDKTLTRSEAAGVLRRIKTADRYYTGLSKERLKELRKAAKKGEEEFNKVVKDEEEAEAFKRSEEFKTMLKDLRKKYKKSSDIYGLELSDEEAVAQQDAQRKYYIDRGIEPRHTIQASARVKLFNELRDAGLSYKEADQALYG